jgi:hypothetical protein
MGLVVLLLNGVLLVCGIWIETVLKSAEATNLNPQDDNNPNPSSIEIRLYSHYIAEIVSH